MLVCEGNAVEDEREELGREICGRGNALRCMMSSDEGMPDLIPPALSARAIWRAEDVDVGFEGGKSGLGVEIRSICSC